MFTCPMIIGGLVVLLFIVLGWAFFRLTRRMEKTYQRALETCQRRLEQQTSRINILTRALPNLGTILKNPQSPEAWKSLCLDETRALVWADGSSYWKYVEQDEELELDIARGTETQLHGEHRRVSVLEKGIGQVVRERVPILLGVDELGREASGFAVPLIVGGHLWGVFRFVRQGRDQLTLKELDVVVMFVNHLALALENRDLVTNLERFYLELVQTLADTLDKKDVTTEGQSRRARELAKGIAAELDLPEEFVYYLEFAALLHDIGKLAIDEGLLKKPGKLTPEEFEIIKKHPEYGHMILAPVSMLAPVAPMVLYHQEWFNGKGYPEGLSGEEIPLGARIVAVIDAWGAMTSDHPWRKALSPEAAINELRRGTGTQFDPQVVEALITALRKGGMLAVAAS